MSEALTNVAIKTSMGEIVLELYPERAPKTVENFLRYVKAGHYSNTIFHRVIDNFMIQGGGFDKKMQEKSTGKPIALEARYALDHDLKNEPGTIAMARTNDPNSATAQFFINVNDNDFLNHQILPEGDPVEYSRRGEMIKSSRAQALNATAGYTPFGKVIKGMDVVEKIKVVRTNGNSGMMPNVPLETVTIESIKVIK
ncbi:peptidylprolyl isomerase [Undibacterium parvum]|nr:peptidylprolyl isomerase [Undibacterium parvum]